MSIILHDQVNHHACFTNQRWMTGLHWCVLIQSFHASLVQAGMVEVSGKLILLPGSMPQSFCISPSVLNFMRIAPAHPVASPGRNTATLIWATVDFFSVPTEPVFMEDFVASTYTLASAGSFPRVSSVIGRREQNRSPTVSPFFSSTSAVICEMYRCSESK